MTAYEYSEQAIAQYGQTEEESVILMSVFGYLIYDDPHYIPNLADRAVSLLIHELRRQYGDVS
jgi:uncharacterized protein (UPF0297 family)